MVPHVIIQRFNRKQLMHKVLNLLHRLFVARRIQRIIRDIRAFCNIVLRISITEYAVLNINYTIRKAHEISVGVHVFCEFLVEEELMRLSKNVVLNARGSHTCRQLADPFYHLWFCRISFVTRFIVIHLVHDDRHFLLINIIHVDRNGIAQRLPLVQFPSMIFENIPRLIYITAAHIGLLKHLIQDHGEIPFCRAHQGFLDEIINCRLFYAVIFLGRILLRPINDWFFCNAIFWLFFNVFAPLFVQRRNGRIIEITCLTSQTNPRQEESFIRVFKRKRDLDILLVRTGLIILRRQNLRIFVDFFQFVFVRFETFKHAFDCAFQRICIYNILQRIDSVVAIRCIAASC